MDIQQFNAIFRQSTLHPLMSVGNLSHASLSLFDPTDFEMFCVVLMDASFGALEKNGHPIQYETGSIFSLRPGQTVSMDLDYSVKPQGWMLAFKPEFLENTGLGRDFYMFSYFDHDVQEAITLSPMERGVILNSFANIYAELQTPKDALSDHMLRLGMGQLLSYCKRFFERKFTELLEPTNNMAGQLDALLEQYLTGGSAAQHGLPTVAWCAEQYNLSPSYFGELVRHQLHMTARELIQRKIVDAIKHMLVHTSLSITQIAEELGFKYPNHLTRLFVRNTGQPPIEWRKERRKKYAMPL